MTYWQSGTLVLDDCIIQLYCKLKPDCLTKYSRWWIYSLISDGTLNAGKYKLFVSITWTQAFVVVDLIILYWSYLPCFTCSESPCCSRDCLCFRNSRMTLCTSFTFSQPAPSSALILLAVITSTPVDWNLNSRARASTYSPTASPIFSSHPQRLGMKMTGPTPMAARRMAASISRDVLPPPNREY